jgi:hypothetical protein
MSAVATDRWKVPGESDLPTEGARTASRSF